MPTTPINYEPIKDILRQLGQGAALGNERKILESLGLSNLTKYKSKKQALGNIPTELQSFINDEIAHISSPYSFNTKTRKYEMDYSENARGLVDTLMPLINQYGTENLMKGLKLRTLGAGVGGIPGTESKQLEELVKNVSTGNLEPIKQRLTQKGGSLEGLQHGLQFVQSKRFKADQTPHIKRYQEGIEDINKFLQTGELGDVTLSGQATLGAKQEAVRGHELRRAASETKPSKQGIVTPESERFYTQRVKQQTPEQLARSIELSQERFGSERQAGKKRSFEQFATNLQTTGQFTRPDQFITQQGRAKRFNEGDIGTRTPEQQQYIQEFRGQAAANEGTFQPIQSQQQVYEPPQGEVASSFNPPTMTGPQPSQRTIQQNIQSKTAVGSQTPSDASALVADYASRGMTASGIRTNLARRGITGEAANSLISQANIGQPQAASTTSGGVGGQATSFTGGQQGIGGLISSSLGIGGTPPKISEVVKGLTSGAPGVSFNDQDIQNTFNQSNQILLNGVRDFSSILDQNMKTTLTERLSGMERTTAAYDQVDRILSSGLDDIRQSKTELSNMAERSRQLGVDTAAFERGKAERTLELAQAEAREGFDSSIDEQRKSIEDKRVRDETFLGLRGGFGSEAGLQNIDRAEQQGRSILASLEKTAARSEVEFAGKFTDLGQQYLLNIRTLNNDADQKLTEINANARKEIQAIQTNRAMSLKDKTSEINKILDSIIDQQTSVANAKAGAVSGYSTALAGNLVSLKQQEYQRGQDALEYQLKLAQIYKKGDSDVNEMDPNFVLQFMEESQGDVPTKGQYNALYNSWKAKELTTSQYGPTQPSGRSFLANIVGQTPDAKETQQMAEINNFISDFNNGKVDEGDVDDIEDPVVKQSIRSVLGF